MRDAFSGLLCCPHVSYEHLVMSMEKSPEWQLIHLVNYMVQLLRVLDSHASPNSDLSNLLKFLMNSSYQLVWYLEEAAPVGKSSLLHSVERLFSWIWSYLVALHPQTFVVVRMRANVFSLLTTLKKPEVLTEFYNQDMQQYLYFLNITTI